MKQRTDRMCGGGDLSSRKDFISIHFKGQSSEDNCQMWWTVCVCVYIYMLCVCVIV